MTQPIEPIRCTVGILTFNSRAVLQRVLESTEEFGERIICDGGSTDGTRELARSRGCVVLEQQPEFQRSDGSLCDFAGAMNQLLDAATEQWFFKVDSDEMPSPELTRELREALAAQPDVDGYSIPLKYVVNGAVIENASTYPMRQVRVVRSGGKARYTGSVHEGFGDPDLVIESLGAPHLLPQWPIWTLIRRWSRYLRIELREYAEQPLSVRWRTGARRHAKGARYLARRAVAVRREELRPYLPLRYEVLRVAHHVVATAVIIGLPVVRRRLAA